MIQILQLHISEYLLVSKQRYDDEEDEDDISSEDYTTIRGQFENNLRSLAQNNDFEKIGNCAKSKISKIT